MISAGISPRIRPAQAALLLGVILCAVAGAAPSWAADPPLEKMELLPGLTATVTADGHLVFGDDRVPLLKVDLAPSGDARRIRSHEDAVFGATSREGAPGGRRGYSASADDDGDGRIDEDRLDGQDNDGDGLVDEDFAAVGDAMVALHLKNGPAGRPIHLEYYHWAHVHLRSAVFLAATGRPDLVDAGDLRVMTGGSEWREIMTPGRSSAGPGHPDLPGGRAYVSRIALNGTETDFVDCGPSGSLWLGVRVLKPQGDDPIRLSGSRLEIGLTHESTPLVFAAAESRQQLIRILDQATTLPRGVTDPMTRRRTTWVAPPLCATCRQAQNIPMTWRLAEDGSLVLAANRTGAHQDLPDPDLFALASGPLGSPDFIRWVPQDGPSFVVPWTCSGITEGPGALTRFDLPESPGRVEYVFSGGAPGEPGEVVTGRFLDGRPWETVLASVEDMANIGLGIAGTPRGPDEDEVDHAVTEFAQTRALALEAAENQPTLSPALLEGWPNPFRDQIQLRYQVPRTIEEAFVWKNPEDMPTGLDLQAAVPWSGGQPRVSVKIYSINGQELVTLEAADLGVGQYSVQWNGTDAFGRQVASGTYFCKLQLDEWSVTRQLVFLR